MQHTFNQSYYLSQLSQYHRLFYAVFELGTPVVTTSVTTAAVGYNTYSHKVCFLVNPEFFFKLGLTEQLFIVCHEAMHVLLGHLDRSDHLHHTLANIAQDIVINETLVKDFRFHRPSLSFANDLCFIDTVFTKEQIAKHHITPGKSFDYYYDLLVLYKDDIIQKPTLDIHLGDGQLVISDEHGDQIIIEVPPEIAQDIRNQTGQNLSMEELEELIEQLERRAGVGAGGSLRMQLEERKSRPWRALIKNKIASLQRMVERPVDTFRTRPRRITNLPDDLYLPEHLEESRMENDKFNIVFFMDASGSCSGHINKFFNLARTVPPQHFNVHAFSFDSKVYPVDLENPNIGGGGGTSFKILEAKVQELMATDPRFKKKHPDLVFVLSDGDGDNVVMQKPKQWYFLLTKNNRRHLPENVNVFLISTFEKMGS